MSLESGRKLGYIASLITVILPIVSIVGVVAIIFSIFATASRIGSGTPVFNALGVSIGLIGFIVALAAISIAGFILFIVAMYRLSNYYNEPRIFKNVLYAFIINILGGIIILVVYFAFIITALGTNILTNPPIATTFIAQLLITYIVAIAVSVAFAIVHGLLYMRAFNKLGEKSGVDNFKTAAILYIIGAIIPLVAWIAWIFAAMGFNKLKATPTPSTYAPYIVQPILSNSKQTKHCSNCGAENLADALYCSSCGKTLQ
jgi:uncharacterized membrane protein